MTPRQWALAVVLAGLLDTSSLPNAAAQVPVGGWTSPNVEWLGNVTLSGSSGAVTGLKHGGYFYAEGLEAIEIFDISDPVSPRSVARIPMQFHEALPDTLPVPDINRDGIDTNGKLLIMSSDPSFSSQTDFGLLSVYDVRDKTSPRLVGQLPGAGAAFTCILGCTWAYAASGQIIDLRDPAKPRIAGRWHRRLHFTSPPGVNEGAYQVKNVGQGRILTASTPMYLLDVRNPTSPRVVARSDGSPHSRGTVVWPNSNDSSIVMSISQSYLMPRCELQDQFAGSSFDSAFKTWDASRWETTGLIIGAHEYRLRNGTYADGDPAFSGASPFFWGCGTTDVDAHPGFRDGGYAAVTGSSHGVKFLKIDRAAAIDVVGWFLPYFNDTFGAYWITDEIVYTVDWPRGIDILRFTPDTNSEASGLG